LTHDIRNAETINIDPLGRGKKDNIGISYTRDDGTTYNRIYNLVNGTKNTEQDDSCQRLAYKIGPGDSDYTGNNDNVGSIAFFLNNYGYGDVPDKKVFEYNAGKKLVTITLKLRSRESDPRYPDNNGYRQMELNRQVYVRGS